MRKALLVVAALVLAAGSFVAVDARSSRSSRSVLGPLATYAFQDGARVRFEGRIVERLDAGSYTYLAVEREGGRRDWVVTLTSSKGARRGVERVSVIALGRAEHFASARLHRDFDGLYFAVVRPT